MYLFCFSCQNQGVGERREVAKSQVWGGSRISTVPSLALNPTTWSPQTSSGFDKTVSGNVSRQGTGQNCGAGWECDGWGWEARAGGSSLLTCKLVVSQKKRQKSHAILNKEISFFPGFSWEFFSKNMRNPRKKKTIFLSPSPRQISPQSPNLALTSRPPAHPWGWQPALHPVA